MAKLLCTARLAMYRHVEDLLRLGGKSPGLGVECNLSAALMGVRVPRSLARAGLLEVLESLLADTRYMTPPMQRKPLFLQRCWMSWDLPPRSEGRVWFNSGDLDAMGRLVFQVGMGLVKDDKAGGTTLFFTIL